MPVPTFEKPEEKEKNFLQKLLYTDLDTTTLDQAWKEYRYIKKHGINKYLEEKERAEPGFMKEWEQRSPIGKILGREENEQIKKEEEIALKAEASKERKEKDIIQPTGVVKKLGTVPKFEVKDEYTFGDDDLSEVGLGESVGHAIVSDIIKIPFGFVNLAAEIKDLFAEEGLPVDQGAVAKLNSWFETTVLGDLMKYSEKKARATGTGRIVEALGQLVGSYKLAGTTGIRIYKKGGEMADNMIDAYKKKKYIKATGKEGKNMYKAAKKAKQLKKISYGREFGAVAFGGLTTAAGIYDIEDIGTFGDIFFDEG